MNIGCEFIHWNVYRSVSICIPISQRIWMFLLAFEFIEFLATKPIMMLTISWNKSLALSFDDEWIRFWTIFFHWFFLFSFFLHHQHPFGWSKSYYITTVNHLSFSNLHFLHIAMKFVVILSYFFYFFHTSQKQSFSIELFRGQQVQIPHKIFTWEHWHNQRWVTLVHMFFLVHSSR